MTNNAPPPNLPARSDALPERRRYQDTGCDLHPRCLDCPRDICWHDPHPRLTARTTWRMAYIRLQAYQGFSPTAIATSLGVSRRTVFRLQRRARSLDPHPLAQLAAERKPS